MIGMPVSFELIIAIFIFSLGTIIGSFLNVVIFRINTGRAPTGRSSCLSCGKTLAPTELVPVLSYLFLRGKCRKCGSRISIQYPLVEILTGIIFLLIYFEFASSILNLSIVPLAIFLFALFQASILISIGVYDLRHKIIPDLLVFLFIGGGAIIAVSRLFMSSRPWEVLQYLDLLAGPIFYLFFYSLWKYSQGKWMGLGDGKLAFGIGLCLGFADGLSAIVLGFWSGALIGILLIVAHKVLPLLSLKKGRNAITMRTEIPFAPFLILGMALVFFYHLHVLSFF